MTIFIFFVVLGVLVFTHELGHFLAAKKAGVRVDEFGFGYPPRALKLGKKWGTLFTLNWVPFGGFVKIFGEDYEENEESCPKKSLLPENTRIFSSRSIKPSSENFFPDGKNFTQVSKKWQVGILASGVLCNIIFAWLLFSWGFLVGVPTSVDNDFGKAVENPTLTIISLVSDSPAQKAGLKAGDKIRALSQANGVLLGDLNPKNVSDFIERSEGLVDVQVDRGGRVLNFKILPEKNKIAENKKIIGINMDMVGTLTLPLHEAVYYGGRTTAEISFLTVKGIVGLIKNAFLGKADLSQVAGPVGIVGLVGDASRLGFAYLLTFTALISINLAIINLMPFPALDGGRIVFVAIEGLTGKKINSKVAHTLNTVGFALLIILMLFITYKDIWKLF